MDEVEVGVGGFNILGRQDVDSVGSKAWREYLSSDKLRGAWQPPDTSPWARFAKEKTIDAIDQVGKDIAPRYNESERISRRDITNLFDQLGNDTAVILDSGGAHSVAMAAEIAQLGYQPVVMFDSVPYPNGANTHSQQELATLLYYAQEAEQLRETTPEDAPPVFVLDTHRDDTVIPGRIDNTYTYKGSDFPTAEELKQRGITRIIYLDESDKKGRIDAGNQTQKKLPNDLKEIIDNWQRQGIDIFYTGVSPATQESRRLKQAIIDRGRVRLLFPDTPPEIFGDNKGIGMQANRQRYIFTVDGELKVVNERDITREMNEQEKEWFRSEIKKRIVLDPSNKDLVNLLKKFPVRIN